MALLSAPTDTIPPTMKAYFDQQLHNYLRSLAPSRLPPTPQLDGKTPSAKIRTPGRFHKDWMFIPPKSPNQQLIYNDSTFYWCTKCNHGAGQWVNLHQTQTHIDGFRHPRARVPSNLLPPDQQQPNPRFQPHQRNSHPGTLPAFPRAPRPTQTPQPRPFVNIAHESPADPITDPSSNNETPITPEQLCLAADIENCFDLLDYEAA